MDYEAEVEVLPEEIPQGLPVKRLDVEMVVDYESSPTILDDCQTFNINNGVIDIQQGDVYHVFNISDFFHIKVTRIFK